MSDKLLLCEAHNTLTKVLRERMSPKVPEAELWLGVLLTVAEDLKSRSDHTQQRMRRYMRTGRFRAICDLIGLDPEATRQTIIKHNQIWIEQL